MPMPTAGAGAGHAVFYRTPGRRVGSGRGQRVTGRPDHSHDGLRPPGTRSGPMRVRPARPALKRLTRRSSPQALPARRPR